MSRRGGRETQPIPPDRKRPVVGAWDDMKGIYNALVDYAMLPTSVSGMLRNKEVVAKVDDKQLLVERAVSMANDCSAMSSELMDIRSTHANRSGGPRNPDDNVACLNVYERYMDWAERYETIVYPTYIAITDQIGKVVDVDVIGTRPTDLTVFKEDKSIPNE